MGGQYKKSSLFYKYTLKSLYSKQGYFTSFFLICPVEDIPYGGSEVEKAITRRCFLLLASFLVASYPYREALAGLLQEHSAPKVRFSQTINILKDAYISEIGASKHYAGFCNKAIEENYPNIAYLFFAFSRSEKIHADNYEKILSMLESGMDEPSLSLLILDSRTNLHNAAQNELVKIYETYPHFLQSLKHEMHDSAIISCMYAWKSHKQHEEKLEEIQKYSKSFFSSVAEELEGHNMDLHVCSICGSTIDKMPEIACDICNYPAYHYQKINPPSGS
jgi:rubrerythrin